MSVSLLQPAPAGPATPVIESHKPRRRQVGFGPPAAGGAHAGIAAGVVALALAALLAAFVAQQPVRGILVFAAMVTVPGAAVMLRVSGADAPTAVGLTIAISLAIDTFVSLAMVWTGFWHPTVGAAVVGSVSVLSILPLCRGRISRPWNGRRPTLGALAIVPAGLALVLWATSLKSGADLWHVNGIGLPVGISPVCYAALAIALGGAVFAICRPEPNGWLIAAFIAVVAVIMYATLPALDAVPQNPWVYKHIGVTNLIVQTGTVHPAVDIYNRWPGFFSLAAVFARLSGQPDAISFAAWSDPVFATFSAMLVAALARILGRSKQVAGWAALLYLVSNFVVQDYFSPQAVAFVLSLAIFVLILRQVTVLSRIRGWIDRLPQIGSREGEGDRAAAHRAEEVDRTDPRARGRDGGHPRADALYRPAAGGWTGDRRRAAATVAFLAGLAAIALAFLLADQPQLRAGALPLVHRLRPAEQRGRSRTGHRPTVGRHPRRRPHFDADDRLRGGRRNQTRARRPWPRGDRPLDGGGDAVCPAAQPELLRRDLAARLPVLGTVARRSGRVGADEIRSPRRQAVTGFAVVASLTVLWLLAIFGNARSRQCPPAR